MCRKIFWEINKRSLPVYSLLNITLFSLCKVSLRNKLKKVTRIEGGKIKNQFLHIFETLTLMRMLLISLMNSNTEFQIDFKSSINGCYQLFLTKRLDRKERIFKDCFLVYELSVISDLGFHDFCQVCNKNSNEYTSPTLLDVSTLQWHWKLRVLF